MVVTARSDPLSTPDHGKSGQRMMVRTGARLAAVLLLCAPVLVACISFPDVMLPNSQSDHNPETSPASPEPQQMTPAPEDPPTDATPDPRMVVKECPGPIAAEAQAVVEAQLAELAAGRFKRALSYASDDFRANVPLDQFRQIIASDYPFLLTSPRLSFNGCVERDSKAYLQVTVTGDVVTVLTYRLLRDPDNSLGIDAATITATSVESNV